MRFHHIGILTNDIAASKNLYAEILGFTEESMPVYDPAQRCRLCTLVNVSGLRAELIEPQEDSPVRNLLVKHGPGPVHLCYASARFDEDCSRLRNEGFVPAGKVVPAVMFGNKRILFFLSPQEELFELLEE
jgi:catechol 2,3-dioxygenase-like lactoylglutathione lyase family enzyme